MPPVAIQVDVPVAGFRVAQAREFWETYPCPPPSTVYGMVLSVVGEPDRLAHEGAEIAVALLSDPRRSVVLRTVWRVKDQKLGPGQGENARPEFQELLTDVRIAVWVRHGASEASAERPCLADRLAGALQRPERVHRFGGLCLGESTHLVDDVRPLPAKGLSGRLLVSDPHGELSLPIWPDHVGSRGTSWGRFSLIPHGTGSSLPDHGWVAVRRAAVI